MIIVELPEEISTYKPKIIIGMTARQLACMAVAVVFGIGAYLMAYFLFGVNSSVASYLSGFIAIPFLAVGFVTKDDMPFEKYMKYKIRKMIGISKKIYVLEPTERKASANEKYFSNAFWHKRGNEGSKCRYRPAATKFTKTKQGSKRKIERAREEIELAQWQLRKFEKKHKQGGPPTKTAAQRTEDDPI